MRRFLGRLSDGKVLIEGDELKHLTGVIRLKEGDKFVAIANDDNDYTCQILSVSKKQAEAKILKTEKNKSNPKKNIVLFQALPKKEAFETIVQKACELGLTRVVPFVSEYTVNKTGLNIDRYRAIITSACKQCERSRFCQIDNAISFEEAKNQLKSFDCVVFANENEQKNTILPKLDCNNIAIVVGCEGGFSQTEVQQLLQLKNVVSLSLGQRILRADTASILLMGLCSLKAGN